MSHSGLHDLLLDECDVTAADMEVLAPAIAHHAQLRTLSVQASTGVSATTVSVLCDHLTAVTQLTSFTISCEEASDDAWTALSGDSLCLLLSISRKPCREAVPCM